MTVLTGRQLQTAKQLKKNKMPIIKIAEYFETTVHYIHASFDENHLKKRAVISARQRDKMERVYTKRVIPSVESNQTKIDAEILMMEIPDDTRNNTQILCGDPLPGRSAFDMNRGHK